jgi:predicted ABC-type ATPase
VRALHKSQQGHRSHDSLEYDDNGIRELGKTIVFGSNHKHAVLMNEHQQPCRGRRVSGQPTSGYVGCTRFINHDLIEAGLSPFDPAAAAMDAGRLVLHEISRAMQSEVAFAFESTLSGRTYLTLIRRARASGYRVHLFYLWIPSAELALARIRDRVESGGHDVPEADVKRRYVRTLRNLLHSYRTEVNSLHLFDNSREIPELVFKDEDGQTTVINQVIYNELLKPVQNEET